MHSTVTEQGGKPARSLSTRELIPRYVTALGAASLAAVAGAAATTTVLRAFHAGCTRPDNSGPEGAGWVCPDGIGYAIPALVGGGALAAAVLVLLAIRTGRRTGPDTVRRMSRHAMWLVLLLTSLPGLLWPLLTLSQGHAAGLFGLPAIAFVALPPAVAHHRPRALPAVLVGCLLAPAVVLVSWQELTLLLPFATLLLGAWGLALGLWLWADARATPVTPSRPAG